ncbi:hypothetical protein [Halomontanus rarus]|uniref:hypothetical protein n=1 Tax=Halomontanus rarus TaxID=3034020 RepID=UPI0023E7DE36|nr:hypothetical protein [Halovivax sp. TS33]
MSMTDTDRADRRLSTVECGGVDDVPADELAAVDSVRSARVPDTTTDRPGGTGTDEKTDGRGDEDGKLLESFRFRSV